MTIILRNCRLLTPQKCGSTWMHDVVPKAAPYAACDPSLNGGYSVTAGRSLPTFVTIRRPSDWIASWWRFARGRQLLGLSIEQGLHRIEEHMTDDLVAFVERLLQRFPNCFDRWWSEYQGPRLAVVALERIASGLVEFLEQHQEQFDAGLILCAPPTNISDVPGALPPELADRFDAANLFGLRAWQAAR